MPRGRLWTRAEDDAIRKAVAGNRTDGLSAQWADFRRNGQRYANRLAHVARNIGRSVDAVRKRAQRIGADSYLMRYQPEPEPDADAREARRILAQIRRVTG